MDTDRMSHELSSPKFYVAISMPESKTLGESSVIADNPLYELSPR